MAINDLGLYTGQVPLIGQTQEVFDANVGEMLTFLAEFPDDMNLRIGEINTDIGFVNGNEANITTIANDINGTNTIGTVATNIADINSIEATIVPNIAEILLADDNAATATAKAAESLASANASESSRLAAEAIFDSFDDRYLGTKTVEPTLDNDGNPLVSGALYFNETLDAMFVYDLSTTTWISLSFNPADHTTLTNIGTLTHAQLEVNIGLKANVTDVPNTTSKNTMLQGTSSLSIVEDFTEATTTTTAIYAVNDIVKVTSGHFYICTQINTIGILLTNAAYFTQQNATLQLTDGIYSVSDGFDTVNGAKNTLASKTGTISPTNGWA